MVSAVGIPNFCGGIAVSCLQQSEIFALRHNREPANAVIVAKIVPGL
jgi:hypothetical protein